MAMTSRKKGPQMVEATDNDGYGRYLCILMTVVALGLGVSMSGGCQPSGRSVPVEDDSKNASRAQVMSLNITGDASGGLRPIPKIANGFGPGALALVRGDDFEIQDSRGVIRAAGAIKSAKGHLVRLVAWSPESDALLYVVSRRGKTARAGLYQRNTLRVLDFKTGEDREMMSDPGELVSADFRWSRDGRTVFIQMSGIPEGPFSLWRVGRDGTGLSRLKLTDDSGGKLSARELVLSDLSIDGERAAVTVTLPAKKGAVSGRGFGDDGSQYPNEEVRVVDLKDLTSVRVSRADIGWNSGGIFSPDGVSLTYQGLHTPIFDFEEQSMEIMQARVDGRESTKEEQRSLTPLIAPRVSLLAYTPDGKGILVTRTFADETEVARLDVLNGDLQALLVVPRSQVIRHLGFTDADEAVVFTQGDGSSGRVLRIDTSQDSGNQSDSAQIIESAVQDAAFSP